MAIFYKYDQRQNKHAVYAIEVKDENDNLIGFRPLVHRWHPSGGIVEEISENYPELKWKVFSTPEKARTFAQDFFENLKT